MVFQKVSNEQNFKHLQEKSKMDWNTFKKDEGIEEDLQIHNRGKES